MERLPIGDTQSMEAIDFKLKETDQLKQYNDMLNDEFPGTQSPVGSTKMTSYQGNLPGRKSLQNRRNVMKTVNTTFA